MNDTHHASMTHEDMLRQQGYHICSPITGSMRPMIRVRRDSVLFVPPSGRLKRYDVALYRADNGRVIMHRVLKVLPEGYRLRGDNAISGEYVREDQVFGVMQGFYRDERFYRADGALHQAFARAWVTMFPLLRVYKWLRWRI